MTRELLRGEGGRVVVLVLAAALSILAVGVLFAGAAAADDAPNQTDAQEDYTVYQGESVGANLSDAVDAYEQPPAELDLQLRTGDEDDSTFVDRLDAEDERLELETDEFEPGEYFLRIEGDDWVGGDDGDAPAEVDDYAFEVVVQELAAEFDDDTVHSDGARELTFDSDRSSYDVVVSSEDLAADVLADVFGDADVAVDDENDTVTLEDVDETVTADFAAVDAGTYAFAFDVPDTVASDDASIEVDDERASRYFLEGPYAGERGDVVELTVSLEDTNRGAVVLGDEDAIGYQSTVEFADFEGHDELTLRYNSHVAGTERQNETDADGWSVVEDGVYLVGETTAPDGDLQETAIDPYEYEISLGDRVEDGSLEWTNDESTLAIEPAAAPSKLVTQTAPADDDVIGLANLEAATLTDADYVAREDHLLVRAEAFGAGGLLESLDAADGDDVSGDLANESITLEVESQEGPPIGEPETWRSSEDLDLTAANVERTQGDLAVAIDYADAGLEYYEAYTVRLVVDDDHEYVDERVELETDLRLEDRDIEWDDRAASLETTAAATPLGWTNVAPGTELMTSIRTDEGDVASAPATVAVDDDGYRYFEPSYDASTRADGVGYEATATDALDDDVEAAIAGAFEGVDDADGGADDGGDADGGDGDGGEWEPDEDADDTGSDDADNDENASSDESDDADGMPAFGIALGLVALLTVLAAVLAATDSSS